MTVKECINDLLYAPQMNFFVGDTMKRLKGRGNPEMIRLIVLSFFISYEINGNYDI